jgi:hypothetical protein
MPWPLRRPVNRASRGDQVAPRPVTGEDLAGGTHPMPGTLTPWPSSLPPDRTFTGDVAAPCPAQALSR